MTITFEDLPSQKFTTVINDIDYTIEVNYNALYDFWSMDLSSNDFTILGIKLVSGIDLVKQHVQVPFGLICNNAEDPTRDTLTNYKLEVIDVL